MLRFMTFLLFTSMFGKRPTVDDFNHYVDKAVMSHLPPLIRKAHRLYPEARIRFHTFELLDESVWQKDLEVRLTEGAVKGLDVVTKRRQSCSILARVIATTVATCALDLSGIEATYTMQTNQREHLFAKRKSFSIDVRVTSSMPTIELTSNGGRNVTLVSFHLNQMKLEMSYDRAFDLDSDSEKKVGDAVIDYTHSELTKIIKGSYFKALSQAFANTCFACE